MRIKNSNTTPYHPQTNAQAEVYNKTIAAYLKTQVLSSTLDWEQYIAPMIIAYTTSYHCNIKLHHLNSLLNLNQGLPRTPLLILESKIEKT
jgi:hypothetical protein